MTRLNDYRSAMLVTDVKMPEAALAIVLDAGGRDFASFVVDHGLGPLWHMRTKRKEFHASRMAAESLYMVHLDALAKIDSVQNCSQNVRLNLGKLLDRLAYGIPRRDAATDHK